MSGLTDAERARLASCILPRDRGWLVPLIERVVSNLIDERCPTVTEVWGVDYHDGRGPNRAPSREVAERWAENYNATVMADPEALLMCRTITTSPWEVVS